jgi:hypothetical protein
MLGPNDGRRLPGHTAGHRLPALRHCPGALIEFGFPDA